jgi:hypothetical protein
MLATAVAAITAQQVVFFCKHPKTLLINIVVLSLDELCL